ncbi:hypothetical protein BRARA_C02108 [Brassica rapa]|uniref:BnaA03g19360D protein n=4 Tax=Brassica TaxID=3705 RepID=A0A078HDB3_BRANA|nr:uncharacterized protein LOC103857970 [Brassica rapa]XP_013740571.1 uncharacterized protein BNAA03G19360D [Brassica napus]KAG5404590.1 hypothetical protein IGI04_010709 [Brassica rapa subsp. trilocularis]KAH0933003.1 hypothetical protein HID58_010120 [Brassica napus]RID70055.1 hypothetical protein BRARA_C02108 [Brassica rapa]CAF2123610.1 unnamed protein product [Brassica napus]CAG7880949.1 unnamed protein product [Brassica rapa]
MGQALNTAKGNGELNGKDLETMAENCYRKRLEEQDDDQEWSFGDFYRIVDEAVEEINRRLGGTQLKVPSVDKLQEAYERHNLGEGKKISKDEFQKLLQEVLIGAGFTGVGGVKEFLLFIFGVPALTVFLKNRIAPTSFPNDLLIPAVTSATVFLLAKLNKI